MCCVLRHTWRICVLWGAWRGGHSHRCLVSVTRWGRNCGHWDRHDRSFSALPLLYMHARVSGERERQHCVLMKGGCNAGSIPPQPDLYSSCSRNRTAQEWACDFEGAHNIHAYVIKSQTSVDWVNHTENEPQSTAPSPTISHRREKMTCLRQGITGSEAHMTHASS